MARERERRLLARERDRVEEVEMAVEVVLRERGEGGVASGWEREGMVVVEPEGRENMDELRVESRRRKKKRRTRVAISRGLALIISY